LPAAGATRPSTIPKSGNRFSDKIVLKQKATADRENSVNDQPAERLKKPEKKPMPQLADYPHRVAEIVRFGDLDPQGHANQAVFLTYFESGRVAMFRNPDLGIGVPGITYVMVRMEVDYMKELRWPGQLEIGTGIAEFGRSSFKAAQVIFHDGVCAAKGLATLVCMDLKTRKATPLPEEAIARLAKWQILGGVRS
jgi:acyl-CoA thioester hydrolase